MERGSCPENLIESLWCCGALQVNRREGFALTSGGWSLFYANLRNVNHPQKPGPLTEEHIEHIATIMQVACYVEGVDVGGLAGVPYTGCPLANALRSMLGPAIPLVTLSKESGCMRVMDSGGACAGDSVVLVENFVTTGESIKQAAEACTLAGLNAHVAITFMLRNEAAREQLHRHGLDLLSCCMLCDALQIGVDNGFITQEDMDAVMAESI